MDEENEYVATVMVLAYGRTTVLNLTSNDAKCFDNTRLYQLSRKLDYAWAKCIFDSDTKSYLKNIFRRDLVNKTTFDVIQEYIDYSTPKYIEIQKENGIYVDDHIGQLYDPVTFDKVIHTFGSISNANSFINRMMSKAFIESGFGVFLISVHKKVIHGDTTTLEIVYPSENDSYTIDLLNLNDYSILSNYFPDRSEYIDIALAKISNEKKPIIPNNVQSHEKPIVFDKDNTNKIFVQNNFIRISRLSYIPCILKTIFGSNTFVNIMDYSCSVLPTNFSENEKIFAQYIRPTHTSKMTDLEMGSNRKFGGRKSLKSILKKKNNKRRKYTVRFSRSRVYKPPKITVKKKNIKRRKKTRSRRKLGGSDRSNEENIPPIFHNDTVSLSNVDNNSPLNEQPRNISSDVSNNSTNYESESNRDSEHSMTSMSSLGDFEINDQEELRSIISLIYSYIFFVYRDSGYSDLVLNQKINQLDTYDLYRKVEYIIDEVKKMEPDSMTSRDRHRDVLETLSIILDLIPNTREPTPIEEYLGGRKRKNNRK